MPETIRSFIAIEIPGTVKNVIDKYLQELKTSAPKLKWVKPESLHITLKFLGEQSTQKTEQVSTGLLNIQGMEAFEIKIKNFGAFPNEKRPRVFWLGIEAVPRETFFSLFNQIEKTLEKIGFEPEHRKFSPHLTLARVKYPDDFSNLFDHIKNHPFTEQNFHVEKFVLMRSFLKPAGAEYRVIQKYPLHG